ncbi:MAG TPA: hypothetical protein VMV46_21480 [Thermoanaerobaculia bacterium]|nr:hypothetical protein [Thermoanaerobaculia bacterium]
MTGALAERAVGPATESPQPASPPLLQPCDILFVRGTSWISRAILRATRSHGEEPSFASHVALVHEEGTLETAVIVEALYRVRRGAIGELHGLRRVGFAAARRIGLTKGQREAILAESERLLGRPYGYGKILYHLADALLGADGCSGSWPGRPCRSARSTWPGATAQQASGLAFTHASRSLTTFGIGASRSPANGGSGLRGT